VCSKYLTAKRAPRTTRSPSPLPLPLATQQALFDPEVRTGDERHDVDRVLETICLRGEGVV
jgi:hypothetical protein